MKVSTPATIVRSTIVRRAASWRNQRPRDSLIATGAPTGWGSGAVTERKLESDGVPLLLLQQFRGRLHEATELRKIKGPNFNRLGRGVAGGRGTLDQR